MRASWSRWGLTLIMSEYHWFTSCILLIELMSGWWCPIITSPSFMDFPLKLLIFPPLTIMKSPTFNLASHFSLPQRVRTIELLLSSTITIERRISFDWTCSSWVFLLLDFSIGPSYATIPAKSTYYFWMPPILDIGTKSNALYGIDPSSSVSWIIECISNISSN